MTSTEWPDGQGWAGIDISRLNEAGWIEAQQDVLQAIPEKSAHINTMF